MHFNIIYFIYFKKGEIAIILNYYLFFLNEYSKQTESIRTISDKAFKNSNFKVLAMLTHYLLYEVHFSEKPTLTLLLWEFTARTLGKKVFGI